MEVFVQKILEAVYNKHYYKLVIHQLHKNLDYIVMMKKEELGT
jgi:hypothetical protein